MRLYSFFVTFLDVNFFSFKFEMYYSFISPSCHSFLTFWNAVYTFERQEKLSLRRETFSLYLPYLSTFLMFSFFFFFAWQFCKFICTIFSSFILFFIVSNLIPHPSFDFSICYCIFYFKSSIWSFSNPPRKFLLFPIPCRYFKAYLSFI